MPVENLPVDDPSLPFQASLARVLVHLNTAFTRITALEKEVQELKLREIIRNDPQLGPAAPASQIQAHGGLGRAGDLPNQNPPSDAGDDSSSSTSSSDSEEEDEKPVRKSSRRSVRGPKVKGLTERTPPRDLFRDVV